MKKLFFTLIFGAFLFSTNAQVNKLAWPGYIGWPEGWNPEGSPATWSLVNDGSAVKVQATTSTTTLSGKFQQRFTPSEQGEYVLKFKAKAENAGQTIKFNLLRCDAWADLANQPTVIINNTANYNEYNVTFTNYNVNVKNKTAATFQLEVYVDGISGSVWFDDIRLFETSNNLVAYQDDFETDKYFGQYDSGINSWSVPSGSAPTTKQAISANTVLQIAQDTKKTSPWDGHLKRFWWALKGVRYRVQFDASCSVNFPSNNGFALEIWNNNKIRPTEFFALTTDMQTFDLVTSIAGESDAKALDFYTGTIPSGEKVYLDNVMISPIHLYHAELSSIKASELTVNWLHSGYLSGDKLKIELIDAADASNPVLIADDVEVTDGTNTVTLTNPLVDGKTYSVRITDKVIQKTYSVYNVADTESFAYTATSVDKTAWNEISAYACNGNIYVKNTSEPVAVKIFTIDGRLVKSETYQGNGIPLNQGIYLVQIGGKIFKVVI